MSDWIELNRRVYSRLEGLNSGLAVAFSVITAERLMGVDRQRRSFTISLRPLLDLLWRAAAGDQMTYKPIAVSLGRFYLSEYCHNDGPEGPDDADDHPAAAILFAAECYLHGLPHFAACVARRAMDAADDHVRRAYDHYTELEIEPVAAEALAREADRQLSALAALTMYDEHLSRARHGLPMADIDHLLSNLRRIAQV